MFSRLQFISSAIFMTSSLSNFVNNLATGIHKIIFKYANDNKNQETYRIKYKHCECCFE